MTRALLLVAFAACGSSSTTPSTTTPNAQTDVPHNVARANAHDDACEMIAAMLAIPDETHQRFYAGVSCGDSRKKPIVKIVALPSVIPPDTDCPAHPFRVFHGETDVMGAVLVLGVGGTEPDRYRFSASYEQPNPTPSPDGGFDVANYYCGLLAAIVERRNGRWVARLAK